VPADLPGEAGLRALSERFSDAETRIRALVAKAPAGDRRELLTEALAILIALRHEDARTPVIAAYLAAFRAVRRGGSAQDARDLAGSLALKLDRGAQTATKGTRQAFKAVRADNLEEMTTVAVVAHVDARATPWTLSSWAAMNATTIGRQASTRGLVDAVGAGAKVVIDVGECRFCQEFAGEAVAGESPLPPFHPSCTCTASAA
jgi:hypothetical protein